MSEKIQPCYCTPNYDPRVNKYDGMPVLLLAEDMDNWKLKCPKCGRSGIGQDYDLDHAIKRWNEYQTDLKTWLMI